MKNVNYEDTAAGKVAVVTLTNAKGAHVVLTSIGAGIVSFEAPDRAGNMADVVLGYANIADYLGDGPAAGKIPGRYANRIAAGRFTLDGKEYRLPVNNGPNCNHGGNEGFHNRNWKLLDATENSAVFEYVSPDGEAGFPGTLTATAAYKWTDDYELQLTLTATTDKATPVNLTNHAYWNLAGHNAGTMLNHKLKLYASHYLPTDPTLIPVGELAEVGGTPMDFRKPKAVGRDMRSDFPALNYGKGYDNCWVIDDYEPGKEQTVAVMEDPKSGRKLEVVTDQPAVQVYTGNYLGGSPVGKSGRSYEDYDAVAIECQDMPDAPNHPNFPSTLLRPGEEYHRVIRFKFS